MLPLPSPSVTTEDAFDFAVSRVRAVTLRGKYRAERALVVTRTYEYQRVAAAGDLATFRPGHFELGAVNNAEMQDLYDLRFQPPLRSGPQLYENLLLSSPNRRCPYCGERRVASLDHFLPKSEYSALTVSPINLVPSCSDCNHNKLNYVPDLVRPAVLHPYFDNVESDVWLIARTARDTSTGIMTASFHVNGSGFDPKTSARISKHFELFDLDDLYRSHSGQELESLEAMLPAIRTVGGHQAVRAFLLDQAHFRSGGVSNSWQRALYMALAADPDYCAGV